MMSKLTYVVPNPKPVERQMLDTCLKVFCDEIVNALNFHPDMQDKNVQKQPPEVLFKKSCS